MSTQITTAFVQQYKSTLFHLVQQKGSRLRGLVRKEMQKGKSAFYDRLGSATAIEKTSRHADTPQIDSDHSRRMVTMADYHWADLIDNEDKLRMLIDPTSDYAMAAAWALGRKMDDIIIAAALGTAYTGETGSSTQTLGTGQKVVPVNGGSATNLNVDALRRAKQILDAADVDPSIPRYCAINASALSSLLSETKVTSSDYATVKALVQGEVDTFLGFKFVMTNRLITQPNSFSYNTTTGLYDAGGSSSTTGKSMIAWAGDGLLLAMGQDITVDISERKDKSLAKQVYARASFGATRLEEEKVVEIICAQ